LALVASDTNIHYYADQLGIPTFSSIRKAEESYWRQSRRERRKQDAKDKVIESQIAQSREMRNKSELAKQRDTLHPQPKPWLVHPTTRLILFSLGVLGILAIGAILVPSADIQLTPKSQTESILIPVAASLETESVGLSGAVPAREVNVTVEGRGRIAASGSLSIPELIATGKIVFTNLTDQEIKIPTGTIVSTPTEEPIRFITLADGMAPPNAESQSVNIQALLPGTESNVRAQTILAIEGPLGLNLTVNNPVRTSGGSFRPAPAPTADDYQRLFAQMLETLHQTALDELNSQVGENVLLLFSDPADYQILEEIYVPAEIQPADEVQLTLRVAFLALVATQSDLELLGAEILRANLPDRFVGQPNTLEIKNQTAPIVFADGTVRWQMQAQWQVGATVEANEAINLALWHSPAESAARLSAQLPVEAPRITMRPDWWPRLPILPFRVSVSINP